MKLTSIFTAAALAFGLVASAAAQTTMKSSISVAQNSHQGVGIDVFAKEVEKRTQGRIKIQNFYSG
jgi:TRAP-type C4-dicarboxylate transport system substrate-binding protein